MKKVFKQLLDIFPALDKAFFIFHAVFGAVILYDLFEIGVCQNSFIQKNLSKRKEGRVCCFNSSST